MNSLNRVQIIGNLTGDPEVRETPNGQKVATLSVATNRTWKDASGQKQEQVEYHNVVFWGKLAEIVEQYLSKGKKVYVEGRLQTRSWDDQSGAKRYRTEIVAENLIMLSAAGGGMGGGMGGGRSSFGGGDDQPFPSDDGDQDEAPKKKRASRKDEEEIHIEDIPF